MLTIKNLEKNDKLTNFNVFFYMKLYFNANIILYANFTKKNFKKPYYFKIICIKNKNIAFNIFFLCVSLMN